jgi:endonuclease/exonuclease/phosphatase family metal-dependent hydrolase
MRQAIYKLFIIVNKIALGTLLIAYLAPEVSPSVTWIPAFFGLAYPVFFLVNVFFVVFWILKWKWAFLISLPVLLLNHTYTNNVIRISFPPITQEAGVKLFSYNVRMFDLYMWSGYRYTRSRAINFVISERPDIAFFQEYYSKTNKPTSPSVRFETELGLNYNYISQKTKDADRGLAIFSRYPIIYQELAHRDGHCYAMIADIVIGDDTIRCINVHLQSVGFTNTNYNYIDSLGLQNENLTHTGAVAISNKLRLAFEKRTFQANQIKFLIENSPYKIIVAGDFNDTPNSYTYHRIRGKLRDAFVECGSGFGASYERFGFPLRIDYFMADSNLHFKNLRNYDVDYSDHHPISTTIGFASTGTQVGAGQLKFVFPDFRNNVLHYDIPK